MKKLGAFLVGLGLVAGTVFAAATNTATSVNGVGFENFTMRGDQAALIRMDFKNLGRPDALWTSTDILGTNYTHDIYLYYWDPVGQQWQSETFLAILQAWDPGTTLFNRGQSVFVQMAGDSTVTNHFTISGEIPGGNNNSSTSSVSIVGGLNAVGYSFPNSIALTNTSLSSLSGGDDLFLYYWVDGLGWQSVTYLNIAGIWDNDAFVLMPGQGYFLQKLSSGGTNWTEVKTYVWP